MSESIPEMFPRDLEKVLKHLPEPTSVDVSIYGNFDYTSIFRQAQEVVEGITLQACKGLELTLENSSKEKIIDIYKISYKLKDVIPTKENRNSRIIVLDKASWYLDNHVKIKLTPWEVNASYSGKEPDYISKMRKELVGTNVRMGIGMNK